MILLVIIIITIIITMQYLVIDTNLEMALTDEYLARMGIWEQTWTETQVIIMMVFIMIMIKLMTLS